MVLQATEAYTHFRLPFFQTESAVTSEFATYGAGEVQVCIWGASIWYRACGFSNDEVTSLQRSWVWVLFCVCIFVLFFVYAPPLVSCTFSFFAWFA